MIHTLSQPVLAESFYRPPIAWLWVLVVLVIALFVLAGALRHERTRWTAMLRVIGLLGLGWVLLGLSRSDPASPTTSDLPRLSILVDTSASMAEMDGAVNAADPEVSRLEVLQASWLTDQRLQELSGVAQVELTAFDDQQRATDSLSLDAIGLETRLLEAIGQAQADATLILSDGHDTTSASQGMPAQTSRAGRLFAVPVGAPRSAPDLALQAWPDSDRLFEDQSTTITATIQNRGFTDQPAVIELVHNGEVVEEQRLTLPAGNLTIPFEVKPELKPGRTVQAHHYTTRIRLAQGEEAYPDNNAQDLFIQVSRSKVRVLLLEGEPYWDTRSLARLVASHPRFDLTAVYGFGSQRTARLLGESYDPASDPEAQLQRYDIIVLGKRVERLVETGFANQLSAFARQGGAVVFARGVPFDERDARGRSLLAGVQSISPVSWGGQVAGEMRVRLGQGSESRGPLDPLRDEAVLSRLPGMLAATRIEGRKAASLVMLQQQLGDGPPMAALTTVRVGTGVVMAVLTEGLWRWQLLPGVAEDAQAESVYGMFWVRALQWLATGGEFLPGQDIAIEADRLGVDPGETVSLRISTRYIENQALDLRLVAIDMQGNTQPVNVEPSTTSGTYTASYTPTETGVVRFELTTPGRDDLIDPSQPMATRIAVVQRSLERRDTSAQPDRLKALTEATGGQCLDLDEPQPLVDYLQTLQALRGSDDVVDYDFNTWTVFALIAGCFGLEWILRRRAGLR